MGRREGGAPGTAEPSRGARQSREASLVAAGQWRGSSEGAAANGEAPRRGNGRYKRAGGAAWRLSGDRGAAILHGEGRAR